MKLIGLRRLIWTHSSGHLLSVLIDLLYASNNNNNLLSNVFVDNHHLMLISTDID